MDSRASRGVRPPRGLATLSVLVAATALLASSACASSADQSASTDASSTTSASSAAPPSATVKNADELCQAYNGAVAANGPLALGAFNPDNPDPDQLPAIGEHLEPVVGAADLLVVGLRTIPGGAEDERNRLEALAEAIELENGNARDEADAAQRKDVLGYRATLASVGVLRAQRVVAAIALGTRSCTIN